MDLAKEFELYLPEWAQKNNRPIPKINDMNKLWAAAWESFMKEKIAPRWNERKQEFLNIKLMTKRELKNQKEVHTQILSEEIPILEEELSGWEKVKKHLK